MSGQAPASWRTAQGAVESLAVDWDAASQYDRDACELGDRVAMGLYLENRRTGMRVIGLSFRLRTERWR